MSAITFEAKNVDESIADVMFKYPVTPEMDEWKELQSLDEMIAACQIPDDVLRKINTENLIDVILDYPLAINIFAYNTPKEGIERVAAYFNGLQELQSRKDSVKIMNARVEALAQKGAVEPVKEAFANAIFGMLSEKRVDAESQRSEVHSNYTPNGSRVRFIYNKTWADYNMTASEAEEHNELCKRIYPNAVPLREENPAYNCHSYAWYSTSAGNLYWLNYGGATVYMDDGSYVQKSSPRAGDKVWYGSEDHSAIYYGNSKVTSKWGAMGLFRHNVNYCPYSASDISYWR